VIWAERTSDFVFISSRKQFPNSLLESHR